MTGTTVESGATTIRPFTVPTTPEAELEGLRARIAATRWPDREVVPDHSQGVQLDTMQEIARYWVTDYDWRKCEDVLKSLPHFVTEIDGVDIHFVHVRSQHEDAMPLIVTHGWPGSVIEQLKIIDPLTNPTAHGASPSDAFHLVIPEIPGYGFSGKPTEAGWDPARIARAWVVLMKRLGYDRFAAQGGDWGAIINDVMGAQAPPELLGIHTNLPGVVPSDLAAAVQGGKPVPADLTGAERRAYDQLLILYTAGVGYAVQMATQPQTLYGIADSPIGLAAWMINHDYYTYGQISRAFVDHHPAGELTRDAILDNITHIWLTNSGVSSGRIYWENKFHFVEAKGVTVPVAVSVFPNELYQAPRSWAEQAYPRLIHFNEVDRGAHFAAWEQPQLLSEEVRVGLRSLR
jgi:pimeloyl-ACP methyl ester carboxylesterase